MKLTNKSVVLFLEEDSSFECHIFNKKVFASKLERYLYNNLLIGAKVNSFTLENSATFNLFNRDISYLKNIFEIVVNSVGNINDVLKHIPSCKIYREEDLKKMYNMGVVPQPYKLLNLTHSSTKYYCKFTSPINVLISILSVCALYDIHFTLHIQLQTHLFKTVRLSFEDI
uniref:Uncharacterized protein n=1 Tax=viral metagenome TaxID=1070528 RepID=A0A6C0IVU4_9ZZZZ